MSTVLLTAVDIPAGGGDIVGAVQFWFGYSMQEDGAAAALINFRDGSATGQILATKRIAANGSPEREFHRPIHVPSGTLHVEEATGSVTGVIFK